MSIPALKEHIKQFKHALCEQFLHQDSITDLTRQLVDAIDNIVLTLFHKNHLHEKNTFCLLAVGGYGRRALQLHSDIDLLLLHQDSITEAVQQHAQQFIKDLWDVGLEISHQMTSVEACANLASQDLTVISSLMDMHFLAGERALMEALQYAIQPLNMWPSKAFFFAKHQEQQARHAKYNDSAYNLEPNLKNGPGGLRDMHSLFLLSQRHFRVHTLSETIPAGFITEKEYQTLIGCQHFLWKVRFGLHMISGKKEDRLLFEHQIKLAECFGFSDKPHSLAVEQFMNVYFKHIKRIRELNDMLLQWFDETMGEYSSQASVLIDAHFRCVNAYIDVIDPMLFCKNPVALLELFVWIANVPSIKGIRVRTIRLIREHLDRLSPSCLESKTATTHFLSIFRGKNPYEALNQMNNHGVLGHYLRCFSAITGQMQYDLFHVYTVDQHTLFVIRNLTDFLSPDASQSFSLASAIMPTIKQREILYLAALFHDIAKGRGGDHSELGAEEARQCSINHGLDEQESALLVWLVKHHLLLSQTAQRQDVYDQKTILAFCKQLPQPDYLDYLYLLTVADICATNQTLWNSWRDSLLKELYFSAADVMQKNHRLDTINLIEKRKRQALKILTKQGLSESRLLALWSHFKDKYFQHEPARIIAEHTQAILACKTYPLVLIMPHHSQGGTEVFIYMPHRDDRFTIATTVLSNHGTTIQEAMISTCDNGYDLDTYIVLSQQHQALIDRPHRHAIQAALEQQLKSPNRPTIVQRRLSRAQAHFNLTPQMHFSDDPLHQDTRLLLIMSDRSGLLANISRVFLDQHITLHNAKIATFGERVEDMFFITNQEGNPLTPEEKEDLKQALILALIDGS